jgi:hypothetical protein
MAELPGREIRLEGGVALVARSRLQRVAGLDFHIDPQHGERHAQTFALQLAGGLELGGRGLQSMVDVHGTQVPTFMRVAQHGCRGQQGGGIRAAGQRHHQSAGLERQPRTQGR